MRKVGLLVALLSLSLVTVPASADTKPTPAPTSTLSPMVQYEMDLQKFEIEMKEYQEARVLREQKLRLILAEFNKSLRKATEDSRIAGKSAGSKAALATARAASATARDEAVARLGPEPKPPVPPIKPMKSAKGFAPSQKPEKKN